MGTPVVNTTTPNDAVLEPEKEQLTPGPPVVLMTYDLQYRALPGPPGEPADD
jgi:hypothetical protein